MSINRSLQKNEHGSCTLVGAGPGDPELLTVRAVKAIQAATLLLVDDLVHEDVVSLARPSARVVHVGKRGGCKSTPQAFIERLMIGAVRGGEKVVRLKGGDPFIFGRGGEEAEHLQAAGITVCVVNGITAGLAAATALGVPLTHREHAQGAILLTGRVRHDIAEPDWKTLAAAACSARLTMVIYMGIGNAAHIQEQLLCGLPAHTPVAVIQDATLAGQRHAVCTLDQLQITIERDDLGSPSVIVVGDVLRGLMEAKISMPVAQRSA